MKKCIFLLLATCFILGCGSNKAPDVSKINVDITFQRFDQDIQNLKKDSVSAESLKKLQKDYPDFAELYFTLLSSITTLKDSSAQLYIKEYLFNPDIEELQVETQKQFGDLEWFKKEVTQAFRYYKYYFPDRVIPKVITYDFGFNNVVVALDSIVGISLDQYLGKTSKFYNHLPEYIKYRKEKVYMVPDLMKGWISAEFDNGEPRMDMLDEMIHQGKTMYMVKKTLPFTQDSVLFGYTSKQMKFCNTNEYMMWSFFLDKKLLYTKDSKLISKYCGEAPFSAGMPDESPGRTGIWLGYKIVTAFMKNNKNITIEQLMVNSNSKQILNSSKYKPKR